MKLEEKLKDLEISCKCDDEYLGVCKETIGDLLNAESINDLPYIDCYGDVYKQEFLDEIFSEYCEFITKDGTKIICEKYACQCFEDKQNHWYFYNVNDEFYMCAECGMKMKYYSDIWKKVRDEFGAEGCLYEEIALPKDWNENGVRKYFETYFFRIKAQEDISRMRRTARERERFLDCDCSECIHMKQCECEYGNNEDDCDDFECR